MIKTILVPVAGVAADRSVLQTALAAARPFAAHLEIVHIRPDPLRVLTMTAADQSSAAALGALMDRLEREAKARREKAKASFQAFCAAERIEVREKPSAMNAVSAAWREEQANEFEGVTQLGRYFDLIVIGRRPDLEGSATATLEAALLGSGRPLLIAPPIAPRTLENTVTVAWKDTPEAARAVSAAMPFLKNAQQVVIVEVHEGEHRGEGSRISSIEPVIAQLAWHGIKATGKIVASGKRPGAEMLLATAKVTSADLVVMGGYGHSRVREMVLGGFTRHVIRTAELPVLMSH